MLQAIVKKGKVFAEDISSPNVSDNGLLIKVMNSCISAGTEIAGVTMSGKPLIKRALEQPANVAKVLNMTKAIGVKKTIAKVKGTLDAGNTTGYSISGIVISVGKDVSGFQPGDHVAAAGAGLAHHAEFVDVPSKLVMKMPLNLGFQEASTITLGGIAMQGVRRADLKLGEYCLIIGAGILGLISLQMLKASGVRVAVSDLDESRLEIAHSLGAEIVINPQKQNLLETINSWTGGYGTDAVLFTAATTSSAPLSDSFKACKKKGCVILVGVSGMNIKREDMYMKELDFKISTSYGPGRYDKNYEEEGLDYPYSYVRWTENRNMTEYLRLLDSKVINLDLLIDSTFHISEVTKAYDSLQQEGEKPLIVLLSYNEFDKSIFKSYFNHSKKVILNNAPVKNQKINYALVGAGGFATGIHMPNLEKLRNQFQLIAVMNRTGHKAKSVCRQYGGQYATTEYQEILDDKNIDLVIIATRHDSHAELALRALKAGKHTFLEKPLATTYEQLTEIKKFFEENNDPPLLMVGFNRRFSKYFQEIKKHTDKRINPLNITYRMNAGFVPLDSWIHKNGGRIVGEACHLIDSISFLTGCKIISVGEEHLTPKNDKYLHNDNRSIILKYEDGSVANIQYISTGSKELEKEYVEVHFDGKSIVMKDFKYLKGYGVSIKDLSSNIPEKGQYEEMIHLSNALKSKDWPIELWDMLQTTAVTLEIEKES